MDTNKKSTSCTFLFCCKQKVLCFHEGSQYEALVLRRRFSLPEGSAEYLVHYIGWSARWDEWVKEERISKYDVNKCCTKQKVTLNRISKEEIETVSAGKKICLGNKATALECYEPFNEENQIINTDPGIQKVRDSQEEISLELKNRTKDQDKEPQVATSRMTNKKSFKGRNIVNKYNKCFMDSGSSKAQMDCETKRNLKCYIKNGKLMSDDKTTVSENNLFVDGEIKNTKSTSAGKQNENARGSVLIGQDCKEQNYLECTRNTNLNNIATSSGCNNQPVIYRKAANEHDPEKTNVSKVSFFNLVQVRYTDDEEDQ